MGEEILAVLKPQTIEICSALLDRPVSAVAIAFNKKQHAVRVIRRRAELRVSEKIKRHFTFPRGHSIGRRIKTRAY